MYPSQILKSCYYFIDSCICVKYIKLKQKFSAHNYIFLRSDAKQQNCINILSTQLNMESKVVFPVSVFLKHFFIYLVIKCL